MGDSNNGNGSNNSGNKRKFDPAFQKTVEDSVSHALYRLTDGLPRKELRMMVSEAQECEKALESEMKLLEKAVASSASATSSLTEQEKQAVAMINASEITPPDRYFTVSALLGRLREPMAIPLPPNATNAMARRQQRQSNQSKKKKGSGGTSPSPADELKIQKKLLERQQFILGLQNMEAYKRKQDEPAALLALWKRISNHRTAAVFRRAVNPKEAPGYTDRILFPIDLGLIRKMITTKIITNYAELHQRIGLICHNCVKFNGRESDYGYLTREFEGFVDECMIQAVRNQGRKSPQSKPPTPTPNAASNAAATAAAAAAIATSTSQGAAIAAVSSTSTTKTKTKSNKSVSTTKAATATATTSGTKSATSNSGTTTKQ